MAGLSGAMATQIGPERGGDMNDWHWRTDLAKRAWVKYQGHKSMAYKMLEEIRLAEADPSLPCLSSRAELRTKIQEAKALLRAINDLDALPPSIEMVSFRRWEHLKMCARNRVYGVK